jgi:hypothetical protein
LTPACPIKYVGSGPEVASTADGICNETRVMTLFTTEL